MKVKLITSLSDEDFCKQVEEASKSWHVLFKTFHIYTHNGKVVRTVLCMDSADKHEDAEPESTANSFADRIQDSLQAGLGGDSW